MRVMISQPRYLPALNYLQRIHMCDVLILLDTVQHQARADGFEHRNRVRDKHRAHWLTLPLNYKKHGKRAHIRNLELRTQKWRDEHRQKLEAYYKDAAFFAPLFLEEFYALEPREVWFHRLVRFQLVSTLFIFGVPWTIQCASEMRVDYEPGPRYLLNLCKKVGATEYISGPAGREYIPEGLFESEGIDVLFHDFTPTEYPQQAEPFIPWLAWIDAFFNIGLTGVKEIVHEGVGSSCSPR